MNEDGLRVFLARCLMEFGVEAPARLYQDSDWYAEWCVDNQTLVEGVRLPNGIRAVTPRRFVEGIIEFTPESLAFIKGEKHE